MATHGWIKRRSILETVFIMSTVVTFVLGIAMLIVFRSFEFSSSIYDTSDEGFDLLALHRYQIPLCACMIFSSVYGIRSAFGPVDHHHHQPLRKYAILTSSLFIMQLVFGGVNFFYAHQAVPKITACQASSGLNSTECVALEQLPQFKVSFFLWQRVWKRAIDEDASSSAAQLLQQIQDSGVCCGYGDKSGCELTSTDKSVYSPVFGMVEPINKCSESEPLKYCAMTQNVSTTELQWDCTVASAWDFPFGGDGQANNGRCLNRNMIENRGCSLPWTSYVFGQVQKSSFLWLFVGLNQICVSTIAWLYLRRRNDKWLDERAIMRQEKRRGSFVGDEEEQHHKVPSSPTEQEALLRYQKILV